MFLKCELKIPPYNPPLKKGGMGNMKCPFCGDNGFGLKFCGLQNGENRIEFMIKCPKKPKEKR